MKSKCLTVTLFILGLIIFSLDKSTAQVQERKVRIAKIEIYPEYLDAKIDSQIEIIDAKDINTVWDKVVNKEARYRYVIDGATI